MKAVIADVPPHILDWRKETGADKWDEMWDGVIHMPPMPNRYHQDLGGGIEAWLRWHWATKDSGNKVYHQVNLASPGGWPNNYRIPDLVLLTPDCRDIDRIEYFEGAPTVVVEIYSPGDDSIAKLPFYAQLGVPEAWVIDRDTKKPTLYFLHSGEYEPQKQQPDGWLLSAATDVRFRHEPPDKIAIQLGEDLASLLILP